MRRDIFHAIADPTRRAIITLIALQAMTPNAIAEHFDTTRQAVSKHLSILTECQLVKQEHKGREIYYQLEIDKMKEIDKWIEQFRKIWETRFNQLDDLLSTIKKTEKMSSTLLFDFSVNKDNKTVHIVREFNAGLDLVWKAWTTAELLDQWWGPKPFVTKTNVMNFEVGGRRFFAMVSPEGHERWFLQKFTSINPKTNFKTYNTFADKDENPELPGSDWDLNFSEQNGTTIVSITIKNESLARMERMVESGFREGMTLGLQQLDELLVTLKD